MFCIVIARQRSCWKVMFSIVSVILFKYGGLCTWPPPLYRDPPDTFTLHYKAQTVDKRAVGIRLKCILVIVHDYHLVVKSSVSALWAAAVCCAASHLHLAPPAAVWIEPPDLTPPVVSIEPPDLTSLAVVWHLLYFLKVSEKYP